MGLISKANLSAFYTKLKSVFQMKINLDTSGTSNSTTTAMAANVISDWKNGKLLDLIFPVGSIHLSTSSDNPGTYIGGNWELWGSGRIPVCVDTNDTDFDTVEKEGGVTSNSTEHSHTVNSHTHTISSHTHTMSGHTHTIASHTHGVGTYNACIGRIDGDSTWIGYRYTNNNASSFPKSSIYVITHTYNFANEGSKFDLSTKVYGKSGGTNTLTSNSTTSTTQGSGDLTTSATSPGTDSQTITLSTIQPYITCYMWRRLSNSLDPIILDTSTLNTNILS